MRTYGQTDLTKLIVAFGSFANDIAPVVQFRQQHLPVSQQAVYDEREVFQLSCRVSSQFSRLLAHRSYIYIYI